MKQDYRLYAIRYTLYLLGLLLLSGCVVRTYPLTRERVDQETTGNRGYLEGQPPETEAKDKKLTRTTQVVEVEFHSPIKFENRPKQTYTKPQAGLSEEAYKEPIEDALIWGNRGYITRTDIPETIPQVEKYTVQKGDTLQKISKKFYGTTKKWNKIYQANPTLKGPNKIFPGQVIDIPVEPKEALKEPVENLK